MLKRFKDLDKLKIPNWFIKPSEADANNAKTEQQEEFTDLQNDREHDLSLSGSIVDKLS